MRLRDVFIFSDDIEQVIVHPENNVSISVSIEGNSKCLIPYAVLDPYINSTVSSIFVHSELLSIHLEKPSIESIDRADEMPEMSNMRECMEEFFNYAESCGVGALL